LFQSDTWYLELSEDEKKKEEEEEVKEPDWIIR
jgi:hypothetical protein